MRPVLIALALLVTACAPAYQPAYSSYSPPVPPPPTPSEERTAVLAFRLVSTQPVADTNTGRGIRLDRIQKTKVTDLYAGMTPYAQSLLARSGSQRYLTTTSTTHIGDGTLAVLYGDLQFGFGMVPTDLGPVGLSLLVRNGTARGVSLDWNAVTIIGKASRAYPVIHRGVKFSDSAAPKAQTTVPPGATLDDFVYPSELVSFVSGYRSPGRWVGERFFETMTPGDRFTLYLPIRHGDSAIEYQFTLEALTPAPREGN